MSDEEKQEFFRMRARDFKPRGCRRACTLLTEGRTFHPALTGMLLEVQEAFGGVEPAIKGMTKGLLRPRDEPLEQPAVAPHGNEQQSNELPRD